MDPKYTNTNKNYWHIYFNDKIIGMDIVSAVNLLHKHKFSYFYRNHNNEKVFSFDFNFGNSRERVTGKSVNKSLELILKELLKN